MGDKTPVMDYAQLMQDMFMKYADAMNQVVSLNLDTFHDMAMKNFNFAAAVRNSSDVVLADAFKGQQSFFNEMMQIAETYAEKMPMAMAPVMK